MGKYHGNTVEHWKKNAEEDYLTTPISVLKYISVLEEQAESFRKNAVSSLVCDHNETVMVRNKTIEICKKCGHPSICV